MIKLLEKPNLPHSVLLQFCQRQYGLSGALKQFDSEVEANYALQTEHLTYLLKISPLADEKASQALTLAEIDLQVGALNHMSTMDKPLCLPHMIRNLSGFDTTLFNHQNQDYLVRVLTFLPGKLMSQTDEKTPEMLFSLGQLLAKTDQWLTSFHHPAANREFVWDLLHASQLKPLLRHVIETDNQILAAALLQDYDQNWLDIVETLPKSIIHNDANDNNVLVSADEKSVCGLIDFGDIVHTATICELAISCAYAMLDSSNPVESARHLIAGYQQYKPISDSELKCLFILIKMRLLTSACMSAYQFGLHPENEYLRITEAPAWALLHQLQQLNTRKVHYQFRQAANRSAHPQYDQLTNYLSTANCHAVCQYDLNLKPLNILDMQTSTNDADTEQRQDPAAISIGRYLEKREIYTASQFTTNQKGVETEARCIHMGIDIMLAPGEVISAPLDGEVYALNNNDQNLDYGPVIILKHLTDDGLPFWTLYGHLSLDSLSGSSINSLSGSTISSLSGSCINSLSGSGVGSKIKAGQAFAKIGDDKVNGGWPPHLHFQLFLDLFDLACNVPGVVTASEIDLWQTVSPDPNLVLGIQNLRPATPARSHADLRRRRKQQLNPALSLSYQTPLKIVRGSGAYLFDDQGRTYLDMVNNVCHVGHAHPHVVAMTQRQIGQLNTNTRYLHDNIIEYAERLSAKFSPELSVCFFTNSGSEANDLALRLANANSRANGVIVLDHAYHGNLQSLIEISPYKCEADGGQGLANHVRKLALNGPLGTVSAKNVDRINEAYASLQASNIDLSAFIAESISGCGGQIQHGDGYLRAAFERTRTLGGYAIADEVQTGFGRIGTHFSAFEAQDAKPDIVTMGKPAGNGHPLGIVITKPEIAAAFNNGMEYFNTFGGNPVSCATGLAVLDVIEEESLMESALTVGEYLLHALQAKQSSHPTIAETRGSGLFLGIEMQSALQARKIVEHALDDGILLSTDGPENNVIKIKPPMVFSQADADWFLTSFDNALKNL